MWTWRKLQTTNERVQEEEEESMAAVVVTLYRWLMWCAWPEWPDRPTAMEDRVNRGWTVGDLVEGENRMMMKTTPPCGV